MLQILLTLLSKLHFKMLIMSNSVAVLVTFWLVAFVTLFLSFPHKIASKGSSETSATLPSLANLRMIFLLHLLTQTPQLSLRCIENIPCIPFTAQLSLSRHICITPPHHHQYCDGGGSSHGRTGALILKAAHQF